MAQQLVLEKGRSQIHSPGLPLAVYREIAAHLRQVEGVNTGLLPQQSRKFDYNDSQIGALWIEFSAVADAASRKQVEEILAYYGDRYSPWEQFQ
ncbi:MAG TPA: hypothetical protein V6D31_06170 [Candidatus Sericytochromatia bacterium]